MIVKSVEHGIDIQDIEDDRRVIGTCHFCKAKIHAESDTAYGDTAYEYGGMWACEDCKDEFLKQFKIGG